MGARFRKDTIDSQESENDPFLLSLIFKEKR